MDAIKHFLVQEVLLNLFVYGFIFWKVGRKWLYPKMDTELTTISGRLRHTIQRYVAIYAHYRKGHETDSEFDCMEGKCAEFNAKGQLERELQQQA